MKNIFIPVILLFQIFLFAGTVEAQNPVLNNTLAIQNGQYKLSFLLEKIEASSDVKLSYNKNNLPLEAVITIKNSNPTLGQVIEYIQQQSQTEILINDNFLIIRSRNSNVTYQLKGVITDAENGEPMVGVNILVKEKMKSMISGPNGSYSIKLEAGEYTIAFSFIGYVTTEIKIKLSSAMTQNIELNPESKQLQEVKIVGERQFFGNMNEGRTIESIDRKEIAQIKTNNVSDVLQARLPGIWVTKASGAPGDHNQIRIRGINSLFGGVDPLYVIDGVPVPIVNLHSIGISDLNIHDVENITVLKDASSNAIYGFQGGNGVIIIDTKRGGNKEINFSVTQGIQQAPSFYNLSNSIDFFHSLDSAAKRGISLIRGNYPDITDTLCSNNWQKRLIRIGWYNEYQLSAGGEIKNTKYYFSGNYYKHNGIITNSDYTKYSFSSSLGRNFFNRLTVEGVYKTSLQQNKNNLDSYWGNRVIYEGINKSPAYNCTPERYYQDTLGHVFVRTYIDYPGLHTRENPDSLFNLTNKYLDVITHNLSGFASIRILDNLFLNYSIAYATRTHQYKTKVLAYTYFTKFNNYLQNTEKYALANNQISLNYRRKLEKHQISLVTSAKFYRNMVEWNIDSLASDLESQTDEENLFTRGNLAILGENGKAVRHINSFLGHINYNYAEKYFISLAANYENLKEGSTRNIKKFFPSVALKWNLAKENGLNRISWLDNFDLIIDWGRSGNYPLNGLSRDLYSNEHFIYPDVTNYGYTVDNLANHHLQPEIMEGFNFGAECSVFKKRLIVQYNHFLKTNRNLIMERDIPYYYGSGRIFINIAEMKIKGDEFKLEAWPLVQSNWKWYFRFNLSTFDQKVTKLDGSDKYYYNDDELIPDFVIKENSTLGNILGYNYLGKVPKGSRQGDYENVIFVKNGMFEKVDTFHTILVNADKVIIGNVMPDYTFNFYNSIQYKNLSLDMLWYGVIGVDKFNSTRASTFISGLNSDINSIIADTNNVITTSEFYQSSYFVEDASFIRLKSISLTYSPEKLFYNKVRAEVTFGIDNLLTITRYKGYDPEATIYTDNTFSDNAVDLGAYPNPRAYYISINLKF